MSPISSAIVAAKITPTPGMVSEKLHLRRDFQQLRQALLQFLARTFSVRIAVLARRHTPLRQRRRDAILPPRALRHQHHSRARQFAQLPQRSWRNPHRRQRPVALQDIHPMGVQLVGLVDLPHHELRFARMRQSRHAARLFDFVDDPIPVGGGLDGHRRPRSAGFQKFRDGAARVEQSTLSHPPGLHLLPLDPTVTLVTVQRDILAHARLLSFPKRVSTARLTPAAGVALSYFHSERSRPTFSSAFAPANASACVVEESLCSLFSVLCSLFSVLCSLFSVL